MRRLPSWDRAAGRSAAARLRAAARCCAPRLRLGCSIACSALAASALAGTPTESRAAAPPPLTANRRFEVLPEPKDGDGRVPLRAAAQMLGDWRLEIAGVPIDGARLARIAQSGDAALERAAREELRLPIDLGDLLLFLDDVLRAGERGLRGAEVVVPSGRARAAGILLHPDDVFEGRPRRYGAQASLPIDRPQPPTSYPAALDGEPLGPRWTARYPNPEGEAEMLAALGRSRSPDYARRLESLFAQLRAQGADVALNSTLRSRERGYLMWGAFRLSRAARAREVKGIVGELERANRDWRLTIPIRWIHPDGWPNTVEAAREMADTYEVVYATEQGARDSNHYTGIAADFVAVGLPRMLKLAAPDGEVREFDLSAPEQSRDLSLSPELIRWLELHFSLRKLRSDYPHWEDARTVEQP